jgi:glycosyl transferase, family 25
MHTWQQIINNFFDKVYVVTLRRAELRQQQFAQRFQGLQYTFFYGQDKNDFTIEDLLKLNLYNEAAAKKIHRYGKPMKPGEIGCSWSHKLIYEDVIKNNFKQVLIFEDDAIPSLEALQNMAKAIAAFPLQAEIIYWGYGEVYKPSFLNTIKKSIMHLQHALGLLNWSHKLISKLIAKPYNQYFKHTGFNDYTYAYSIHGQAAAKLLAMQTPIQYIADNLLTHACASTCAGYMCVPKYFLHDDSPANISFIR